MSTTSADDAATATAMAAATIASPATSTTSSDSCASSPGGSDEGLREEYVAGHSAAVEQAKLFVSAQGEKIYPAVPKVGAFFLFDVCFIRARRGGEAGARESVSE